MKKKHILIIGGGFGGLYVAKSLLRKGYKVTLVSNTNFFTFTPFLPQMAAGFLNANDISLEYTSYFRDSNFTFYRETATKIDFENRTIKTANEHEISYDYLVLSTGAKTNFFGTKGSQHTLELKNIADAREIKRKIVENAQGVKRKVAISLVGAGPTGVELTFEINEFLNTLKKQSPEVDYSICVIQADSTLCPTFPTPIQGYALSAMKKVGIDVRLNTLVTEITPGAVITKKGEKIESDLTIWTAGVTPNSELIDDSMKDARGNVICSDSLQILGREFEFAVGDIITKGDVNIPKLAQTAIKQGELVAENIDRHIQRKTLVPYTFEVKNVLILLGKGRGAGRVFGFDVKGFLGWFLWKGAYLSKIPGFKNKLEVFTTWFLNSISSRSLFER